MSITSYDIKRALAARHSQDLYFTEVKSGTSMAPNSRIDALAIRPSYAHYLITGYEIKVSRADFIGDTKWPAYLNMCHQLYFCTSPGVVNDVSEIPDTCGLIEYRGTSSRPFKIVKKAPIRMIDPPEEMYKYLLFKYTDMRKPICRVDDLSRADRMEAYKKYIEDKIEFKEVGFMLSKKIRKEEYEASEKIRRLKAQLESEKSLREYVSELAKIMNIDPDRYWSLERLMEIVSKQVSRLSNGISLDPQDISDISTLKFVIDRLSSKYLDVSE